MSNVESRGMREKSLLREMAERKSMNRGPVEAGPAIRGALSAMKTGLGSTKRGIRPINAKYDKKGSNYRAGSPIREVPAIEESLYTEDDLG